MTILGIVGSEAAKFTVTTETKARQVIRDLLGHYHPSMVTSGECHLGGVDIFAKEEARQAGFPFHGFPPATLAWNGGYKERNMQIAKVSTHVVCITLRVLPPHYKAKSFDKIGCCHCGSNAPIHAKSGGCWTLKYALKIGKTGELIVID